LPFPLPLPLPPPASTGLTTIRNMISNATMIIDFRASDNNTVSPFDKD
jgi:hypothetical protein